MFSREVCEGWDPKGNEGTTLASADLPPCAAGGQAEPGGWMGWTLLFPISAVDNGRDRGTGGWAMKSDMPSFEPGAARWWPDELE